MYVKPYFPFSLWQDPFVSNFERLLNTSLASCVCNICVCVCIFIAGCLLLVAVFYLRQ